MTGPIDDTFTVRDADVRAGRKEADDAGQAVRDRELTFLVGLAVLAAGVTLFVAASWGLGQVGVIAGVGAGLLVAGLIVTLVALWARADR